MAIGTWPSDFNPHSCTFFLEANASRVESPLSRAAQVIIRPGARWVCELTYDQRNLAISARLDALIAKLDGAGQEIMLWDFRRAKLRGTATIQPIGPLFTRFSDGYQFTDASQFIDSSEQPPVPVVIASVAKGAEDIIVSGVAVGTTMLAGDYIAIGDRLHMVVDDALADAAARIALKLRPRLRDAIAYGVTGNLIDNPLASGAVAGTPGTMPTGWAQQGYGGLSTRVSAIGTESGMPYIEVRVTGTAAGGVGVARVWFDTADPAFLGDVWRAEVAALNPGSPTGTVVQTYMELSELDSLGAPYQVNQAAVAALAASGGLVGVLNNREIGIVIADTRIAAVRPSLSILFANGTVDWTMRIAYPRLRRFTGPKVTWGPAKGRFRLADNQQGRNPTRNYFRSSYTLQFVESLP